MVAFMAARVEEKIVMQSITVVNTVKINALKFTGSKIADAR
jgi:hypothetical protein